MQRCASVSIPCVQIEPDVRQALQDNRYHACGSDRETTGSLDTYGNQLGIALELQQSLQLGCIDAFTSVVERTAHHKVCLVLCTPFQTSLVSELLGALAAGRLLRPRAILGV